MYAIDYPDSNSGGVPTFLEKQRLCETEKALIAHGNAERLLGI